MQLSAPSAPPLSEHEGQGPGRGRQLHHNHDEGAQAPVVNNSNKHFRLMNVNYVAIDLLTQIPQECKKELNTA